MRVASQQLIPQYYVNIGEPRPAGVVVGTKQALVSVITKFRIY